MLDKFIAFFVHNVVAIIEVVFVVVIPTTIYIVYRSFKQERDTLELSIDQMKGLEDILKKHLGNLPPPSATMAAPAGATAAGAAVPADMQALISEKEAMIKSLTDKIGLLEKATAGNPNVDSKEWEKKIADLKDRLAEYEIIEDDIANLTFYKAENLRLKEELGKLGGNPSAAAPAAASEQPAPVPEPAAAPAPSGPLGQNDIEALMAANAAPAENVISFPQTPAPAAPPQNTMADFEAAVKQKNALETATSKMETKKSSKLAVDEESVERKVEFPSNKPEGDIISEFSAAVGEPAAPAPAAEPTAATPGFQADNVNSEKLLDEINDMASKPAPAAEEGGGGDDSKKLISEFEAFVKGSN